MNLTKKGERSRSIACLEHARAARRKSITLFQARFRQGERQMYPRKQKVTNFHQSRLPPGVGGIFWPQRGRPSPNAP